MKKVFILATLISACGTPPADEAERAAEAHMTNMEYFNDAVSDGLGEITDTAGTSITDAGEYVYVRFKAIPDSIKGEKGDTGATGAAGAGGEAGAEGAVGQRGADGRDGKDGTDGKDGVDGESGSSGEDGEDGEDGKNGANGESCGLVKKLNRQITPTRCKYDYFIKCEDDQLKIKTQTESCD